MNSQFLQLFPSRSVAIEIAGFGIHWYGLLYLLAFLIAYALLPRLQRHRSVSLSKDAWTDILTWSVLGVIFGGRLGYVLLYDPMFYLSHPLKIAAVWEGGMSSHGGFIGVMIALLYCARKHRIDLRTLGDIVVVPVAIGLALGRVGNFVNQELYGIPTALPWGIAIPGVEELHHPTQIYAMFKDLFIALVCFLHLRTQRPRGETGALFLILYGCLRFVIEFVREPTHPPFILGSLLLTRGQLYTIPIILGGIAAMVWVRRAGK